MNVTYNRGMKPKQVKKYNAKLNILFKAIYRTSNQKGMNINFRSDTLQVRSYSISPVWDRKQNVIDIVSHE